MGGGARCSWGVPWRRVCAWVAMGGSVRGRVGRLLLRHAAGTFAGVWVPCLWVVRGSLCCVCRCLLVGAARRVVRVRCICVVCVAAWCVVLVRVGWGACVCIRMDWVVRIVLGGRSVGCGVVLCGLGFAEVAQLLL